MESDIKTKRLRIGGMTCVSCQNKIERKLRNTAGIKNARVSYSSGTADVTYDADIISLKDISGIIQKLDYKVLTGNESRSPGANRVIGLLVIIAALYVLLQQFGVLNLLVPSRLAETNMGYGMLFVIGLITSVHCAAMCGGINLSQCIPRDEGCGGKESRLAAFRPTFLYNLGRVISYTAVGFIVGALGSAITFSNAMQGVLKLAAGVFMIIMGVNMLGIFPWLRKLNPRMPKIFSNRIDEEKSNSKSPLFVGLLNGLMPCGPLQAMQLYALSTGNPLAGALSMFLFSLGTVPLMFGLGALGSALGKKFTHKIMTFGAVLVVVLGLSMLSQGFSLAGFSLPQLIPESLGAQPGTGYGDSDVRIENGVQIVDGTISSGRYPSITVQAGIPVKWTIDAPEGSLNGCNNRMIIPEYNIEYKFKTGENVIEFTPAKPGKFSLSCWMGMIRSSINVVEAGAEAPAGDGSAAEQAPDDDSVYGGVPAEPVPAGYVIPTDEIAVATLKDSYQQVTIELTDDGFLPAVIVVQAGIETKWIINNSSSKDRNFDLLVPYYSTQVPLVASENPLYLYPTDDFDFSNGDNTFYGYVKVVDDLKAVDIEAVKKEVSGFQTLIWPPETFGSAGGAPSCH